MSRPLFSGPRISLYFAFRTFFLAFDIKIDVNELNGAVSWCEYLEIDDRIVADRAADIRPSARPAHSLPSRLR